MFGIIFIVVVIILGICENLEIKRYKRDHADEIKETCERWQREFDELQKLKNKNHYAEIKEMEMRLEQSRKKHIEK